MVLLRTLEIRYKGVTLKVLPQWQVWKVQLNPVYFLSWSSQSVDQLHDPCPCRSIFTLYYLGPNHGMFTSLLWVLSGAVYCSIYIMTYLCFWIFHQTLHTQNVTCVCQGYTARHAKNASCSLKVIFRRQATMRTALWAGACKDQFVHPHSQFTHESLLFYQSWTGLIWTQLPYTTFWSGLRSSLLVQTEV